MSAPDVGTPLSPALPASVEVRVLRDPERSPARLVPELLASHDLVVLRGAAISDESLARIGATLGDGCSELKRFVAEGPTGPAGQSRWHHVGNLAGDRPAAATLMAIREFPAAGGEFEVVSNRQAWRQLPAAEQARLRGLRVRHDFSSVRHTTARPDDPSRTGVLPLVEEAQDDPYLVLGYHASRVEGMAEAESRALLDRLMAAATRDGAVYRHAWRTGDLLAWRNRPLMHHTLGFDTPGRRAMHEVTIRELRL